MPLLTPRPGRTTAATRWRTTAASAPTSAPSTTCASSPGRCASTASASCLDLVLNHVAREHEWAGGRARATRATAATSTSSPTASVPDAYERTLPEVFPDFAPGNFTWDDELGGWVWTTFNDYQWDVNWANPDVLCEYADIVLFLANLGVEVLRLDAIAFIWKRLGTNCQNQPEVHALTQALRTVARIACPAMLFKAEAIVGPQDLPAYLGTASTTARSATSPTTTA